MVSSVKGTRLAVIYQRSEEDEVMNKDIKQVICLFQVNTKVDEYAFIPM